MAKSTIVIPNYNGIKYIETCLDSIYQGTVTDVAVIVVDNACRGKISAGARYQKQ